MKKTILTTVLVIIMTGMLQAQSFGEIKGKVVDSISGEPLTGTTVYVEANSQKIAAIADINGDFTIKPLVPGTYNVYATMMSYNTWMISSVIVNPDKATYLNDVEMVSTAIYKKEIVVFAFKNPLIDPENPSIKPISRREIEENANGKDIVNLLRTMYSDIYVSESGEEVYFRGARDGDAVYFIDGVKQMTDKINVPSSSIGSITVYSGGVPAKYGDFTGGVVAVETRSYFDWVNEQAAKK